MGVLVGSRVNQSDMVGLERPPEPGRFYCQYDQLEEYHAGMWRRQSGEAAQLNLVALAARLLRDLDRFRAALAKVLREWPTSCRAELTRRGNHLAWLGQAACCIVHGVPEDLTRRAWWKLSAAEQASADEAARAAEVSWREVNRG